jgi:hypothetical protein
VAAAAGWSFHAYGSVGVGLARLRGEVVVAESGVIDFGDAAAGETRERPVTVWNLSPGVVRVVGGTTDCACTTLADLPLTLSPGQRGEVRVRLRFIGRTPGLVALSTNLTTDHPTAQTIRLRLRGRQTTPGPVPGG